MFRHVIMKTRENWIFGESCLGDKGVDDGDEKLRGKCKCIIQKCDENEILF
jgi:hypothetical protein